MNLAERLKDQECWQLPLLELMEFPPKSQMKSLPPCPFLDGQLQNQTNLFANSYGNALSDQVSSDTYVRNICVIFHVTVEC